MTEVVFHAIVDLEKRVRMLEGMLETYFAEAPSRRIHDVEEKLESLTRTLELLQEVTGTEFVVTLTEAENPIVYDKEGQFVSSLSKMDALAQDECYPFGKPLLRENEY